LLHHFFKGLSGGGSAKGQRHPGLLYPVRKQAAAFATLKDSDLQHVLLT